MDECLTLYKKLFDEKQRDENIEFEIRLKSISQNIMINLSEILKKKYGKPIRELSINAINKENIGRFNQQNRTSFRPRQEKNSGEESKMRVINFDSKGVKIQDSFSTKQKVCSKKIDLLPGFAWIIPATLNISIEKSSLPADTKINAANFRVKIRDVFNVIEDKKILFRWDVTLVIAGDEKFAIHLSKIKDKFFNEKSMNELIDMLYSDESLKFLAANTHFEVELEYISSDYKDIDLSFQKMIASAADVISNIKFKNIDLKQNQVLDPTLNLRQIFTELAILIGHNTGYINNFKSGQNGFKALCNNAIVLDKRTYKESLWPPVNILLTDKADGNRTLLYFNKKSQFCDFGRKLITISAAGLKEFNIEMSNENLPSAENKNSFGISSVLIDCEEINNVYYCFDLINFKTAADALINNNTPFEKRLEKLEFAIDILENKALKKSIFAKKYVKLGPEISNFQNQIKGIYEDKNRPYETDGLILVKPNHSYLETANYKWKPWNKNSIDFLALDLPEKFKGAAPFINIPGFKCYLLFVTISEKDKNEFNLIIPSFYKYLRWPDGRPLEFHGNIIPINFQCSFNPYAYIYYTDQKIDLAGKIIELVYKRPLLEKYAITWEKSGGNELTELPQLVPQRQPPMIIEWEFIKIREDREAEKNFFGNYFTVAMATYTNYVAEFNLENLWNPAAGYFQHSAETIYKAANGYKRFVISNLIKEYIANSDTLLDIAGGRGADIGRYISNEIKNIIITDIDKDALQEANMRYLELMKKKKKTDIQMNLKIVEIDMKADPEKIVLPAIQNAGLESSMADNIICNFALHYFCNQTETIMRIAQICKYFIKPGGHMIFTVMNGCKIWKRLVKITKNKDKKMREIDSLDFEENINSTAANTPFMKYKIIRKFKLPESKLEQPTPGLAGDMIEVKLPFSDELYEEPLCNIKYVIEQFERAGFKRVKGGSFDKHFEEFSAVNREMFNRLSEIDREYISLHDYVVLKSVATKK